jgi:hypothetical protein
MVTGTVVSCHPAHIISEVTPDLVRSIVEPWLNQDTPSDDHLKGLFNKTDPRSDSAKLSSFSDSPQGYCPYKKLVSSSHRGKVWIEFLTLKMR